MKQLASSVYKAVVGVLEDGTPFTVDFSQGPVQVEDVVADRFTADSNVLCEHVDEESVKPQRRRRNLDAQNATD